MNSNAILRTLFCLAAALPGTAICASPKSPIVVQGTLVPVGVHTPAIASVPTSAAASSTMLYSLGGALTGDATHLGNVLTLHNGTTQPDAQITGADLYVYSTQAQVVRNVQIQLQFWESYAPGGFPGSGGSTPQVFANPNPTVLIVQLNGPFSLDAGTAYETSVSLPKSIDLRGYSLKGLSEYVFADYSGAGNYVISSALVPAYAAGVTSAQRGTDQGNFANADVTGSDNFAPADADAQRSLALNLYGAYQMLVQCTGWNDSFADYGDQEEFDSTWPSRWNVNANGGTFSVDNGMATASAPNGGSFPYLTHTGTNYLPPSGDYSVRWLARYDNIDGRGTATLAISQGLPSNSTPLDTSWTNTFAYAWQDTNGNYNVNARGNLSFPMTQVSSAGTPGVLHDVEYCFSSANSPEVWVDGVRQGTFPPSSSRPDSLWFGDYEATGGTNWNRFTLYRIHVRQRGTPNPITVNASATAATRNFGMITPSTQIVNPDEPAIITVTPNPGYVVAGLAGDTCTVVQQPDGTWITNPITSSCNITATFADAPSQCTGASDYGVSFNGHFPQDWNAYPNGGAIGGSQNRISVSSSGTQFPFFTARGSPIPSSGSFSVRWIAKYTGSGGAGDGTLVVSKGLPANNSNVDTLRLADVWQDNANGFQAHMNTGSFGAVQAENPPQLGMHDIEYCWLPNSVEMWVDGVRKSSASNAGLTRPDSLWFGNPVVAQPAGVVWNPFTLYYIEVHALNDEIFRDGFGN